MLLKLYRVVSAMFMKNLWLWSLCEEKNFETSNFQRRELEGQKRSDDSRVPAGSRSGLRVCWPAWGSDRAKVKKILFANLHDSTLNLARPSFWSGLPVIQLYIELSNRSGRVDNVFVLNLNGLRISQPKPNPFIKRVEKLWPKPNPFIK